ncbi:MAG: type II toxin-antitoxin system prevent-host-death family antitoxin [Bacilli bacterium]|nr:type II toxin-antitoxin system prevent-host-death family antitoxin [Bacilli bacterium]
MCIITATEFKTHFGKYMELAKSEEIVVTSFGKVVFTTVPGKVKRMEDAKSLVGILPAGATIGEDEDERG